MKKEMKILSCTGIVGYGFPEESFFAGVAQKPDLIACDAGSTDPGPYYLGAGIPFTNATAVKRDMTLMLKAARELDIPLVIGTCGGAGANPHLMREVGILKEIAAEMSEDDKGTLRAELEELFGREVKGFVWPYGNPGRAEVKDYVISTGVYYIRNSNSNYSFNDLLENNNLEQILTLLFKDDYEVVETRKVSFKCYSSSRK